MSFKALHDALLSPQALAPQPWQGQTKIPWDEPAFSARMLKEHLSQDHDLASRRIATVNAQVQWMHRVPRDGRAGRILDLGCGPGLYLAAFARLGYTGRGLDFSPASVDYARTVAGPDMEVVLADLRNAELGSGFHLACLLYGEFNTFPPHEAQALLGRIRDALDPGGILVLEPHTHAVVEALGRAPSRWYASPGGLFCEGPHLVLESGCWFEQEQTALQRFVVADLAGAKVRVCHSTTRAWTEEDYRGLLSRAGFTAVTRHHDWPGDPATLMLLTARAG